MSTQPEIQSSKHTPGPWRRHGMDPRVIGPTRILRALGTDVPQEQAVCRVYERMAETDPNAHLISAAPELYEALKAIVDFVDADASPTLEICVRHYDAARAALQKAEGQ